VTLCHHIGGDGGYGGADAIQYFPNGENNVYE